VKRIPLWLDARTAAALFTVLIIVVIVTDSPSVRRFAAFGAIGIILFGMVVAVPFFWRRWHDWKLRQWRRQHGLCQSCGYDLTGNVSGVCPECGATAP